MQYTSRMYVYQDLLCYEPTTAFVVHHCVLRLGLGTEVDTELWLQVIHARTANHQLPTAECSWRSKWMISCSSSIKESSSAVLAKKYSSIKGSMDEWEQDSVSWSTHFFLCYMPPLSVGVSSMDGRGTSKTPRCSRKAHAYYRTSGTIEPDSVSHGAKLRVTAHGKSCRKNIRPNSPLTHYT